MYFLDNKLKYLLKTNVVLLVNPLSLNILLQQEQHLITKRTLLTEKNQTSSPHSFSLQITTSLKRLYLPAKLVVLSQLNCLGSKYFLCKMLTINLDQRIKMKMAATVREECMAKMNEKQKSCVKLRYWLLRIVLERCDNITKFLEFNYWLKTQTSVQYRPLYWRKETLHFTQGQTQTSILPIWTRISTCKIHKLASKIIQNNKRRLGSQSCSVRRNFNRILHHLFVKVWVNFSVTKEKRKDFSKVSKKTNKSISIKKSLISKK